VTTNFPPLPATVGNQGRPDFPPQFDDAVTQRKGARITGLKTFHIVGHQEGKWHIVVLAFESGKRLCLSESDGQSVLSNNYGFANYLLTQ
jgi:hypothetical protein